MTLEAASILLTVFFVGYLTGVFTGWLIFPPRHRK